MHLLRDPAQGHPRRIGKDTHDVVQRPVVLRGTAKDRHRDLLVEEIRRDQKDTLHVLGGATHRRQVVVVRNDDFGLGEAGAQLGRFVRR